MSASNAVVVLMMMIAIGVAMLVASIAGAIFEATLEAWTERRHSTRRPVLGGAAL